MSQCIMLIQFHAFYYKDTDTEHTHLNPSQSDLSFLSYKLYFQIFLNKQFQFSFVFFLFILQNRSRDTERRYTGDPTESGKK